MAKATKPSLKDKILKASSTSTAQTVEESSFFSDDQENVLTPVPAINVALSGSPDVGMVPGVLSIAGKSKHFKSSFALMLASCFQKKYPEGYVVFYDTEFGTPKSYIKSFGIDTARMVHHPVKNIEELQFDMVRLLDSLDDNDKIMILIDSVGNIASKKELQDALDEKSKVDMTRAKALKALFRMVVAPIRIKGAYLIAINHTYDSQGLFSKEIMSGGTGGTYGSNAIWMISRKQDKDGNDIAGYDFRIKIEKSRFVKEGVKIPITVSYEKGIDRYSMMYEIAVELGLIEEKKSRVILFDFEKGEFNDTSIYKKDIPTSFYKHLLSLDSVREHIRKEYQIPEVAFIENDEEEETNEG